MIGAIAGIAHIANIVNIADATNAAHIVHVLAASVPSTVPVTHTLPDIPRSYTAICEWAACMVYIAVLYRRVPLRRSIIVSAVGLPAIVAVQYFDGSMPIWFWIVGMLLAFGCMYLTILFGAGTGKREGLYITARAFVLAELVASLHWQIVAFIGTHDAQATSYGVQAIVMLIVISMVAYILFEGISTLFQPGFLTEPSRANGTQGGVLYQLFDSFYLLLITLIISVPISLGGAVFLVEYAPNGPIRDIASTAIETLSSLPSIVVGMFGFLVFSVQLGWKYSIISGAVALTMFNIPILVRVIQQALEDVPQAQRDACLAVGLTRWEATLHILIPEAMPAIVTGIVLSAGRVFGEAAALLFTSGMSSPVRLNFLSFNLSSPTCAWNVFRPGESLAVHIYKIYGEGSPEAQQIVWGTAALLMICVLLFNVVARIVGKQLARRMTAE